VSQLADLSPVKAQFDLGDYQGASEALGRLLLAEPTHADAQALLAECLLRLDRWEPGLAAIDRLIELTPTATFAHRMRCVALENLGRYDEAIASARTAISIDGKEANAFFLLGKALMHLGRDPEARAALEEAARLEPNVPLYRFTLANLLFEAVPAVAEALLERIVADAPKNAVALNNVGVLKERKHERPAAKALYARASEADPTLKAARKNRDRLEPASIRVTASILLALIVFGVFGAAPGMLGAWLSSHGHPTLAGVCFTFAGLAILLGAAVMVPMWRKKRGAVPERA